MGLCASTFLCMAACEVHECTSFSPTGGSFKPRSAGEFTFTKRC